MYYSVYYLIVLIFSLEEVLYHVIIYFAHYFLAHKGCLLRTPKTIATATIIVGKVMKFLCCLLVQILQAFYVSCENSGPSKRSFSIPVSVEVKLLMAASKKR